MISIGFTKNVDLTRHLSVDGHLDNEKRYFSTQIIFFSLGIIALWHNKWITFVSVFTQPFIPENLIWKKNFLKIIL